MELRRRARRLQLGRLQPRAADRQRLARRLLRVGGQQQQHRLARLAADQPLLLRLQRRQQRLHLRLERRQFGARRRDVRADDREPARQHALHLLRVRAHPPASTLAGLPSSCGGVGRKRTSEAPFGESCASRRPDSMDRFAWSASCLGVRRSSATESDIGCCNFASTRPPSRRASGERARASWSELSISTTSRSALAHEENA